MRIESGVSSCASIDARASGSSCSITFEAWFAFSVCNWRNPLVGVTRSMSGWALLIPNDLAKATMANCLPPVATYLSVTRRRS